MSAPSTNTELQRLEEDRLRRARWRTWGPYLSERQWGTVREDYSPDGNFWAYFTHEMARSRAYRWGEDGIGGLSDDTQALCHALAMWNGADPILKERLFGLTNNEGNHGEDVKEHYYYLDATPTHSYLKMLYKYPQSEFPYRMLKEENHLRGKLDREFELLDTGIFNENRYFDVFIEYAKASPNDILIRITAHNRADVPAPLHLVPQLWFRNTWSWQKQPDIPRLSLARGGHIEARHPDLGIYYWYADGEPEALFCENTTNGPRLHGFGERDGGFFKDGFHDYIVSGETDAVNPANKGTKAAFHYALNVPAADHVELRLRLTPDKLSRPFNDFDATFALRIAEADEFYAGVQKRIGGPDERNVQRQALAGMIWNKQFYYYNVYDWLNGDPLQPKPPKERLNHRNAEWEHLNGADILSMPDKWEFPWYAAWDLAFHCVPFALIDPEFAKSQLLLLTREWYMHPNGQLPAYEGSFSDVNPPVHAWATWRVFSIDRTRRGDAGDLNFLERIFHKLMLNFTWWVNRKDTHGRNVYQGGFLGLDNIGVFDRGAPPPLGGHIDQADATSWMAMYCLDMMRISLELARHNNVYEDIATKFFQHFLLIAKAMNELGEDGAGLWDAEDQFYYDALSEPDKGTTPLKVRSMVGLIPLFAVETLGPETLLQVPYFRHRIDWFLERRPDLRKLVHHLREPGRGEQLLLTILRGNTLKNFLKRMLDETEFLSDFGVRALSRFHEGQPYEFTYGGNKFSVKYSPGESDSDIFGGNSNWRGPIWFPVNFVIVESLREFGRYYGDEFTVECPTGSGNFVTLEEAAAEIARRLTHIFVLDENGRRPVYNHSEKMQQDPHFRDHLLFYEYFHGDSGRGCGASHQCGWTGLVANLIQFINEEPERDDG